MTRKQRAIAAIERLKKEYPQASCSLTVQNPLQLLIATRLSAQCTDARVNLVTPALFARFPDIAAFAGAEQEQVEELIRTCGLYKTKAHDIIAMCQALHERFDDKIPDTVEQLVTLPGVGRKTANLILGDIYKQPAYVCDTHCIRITGRLGMTDGSTDPVQVERQLRKVLPGEESSDFCHRIVLFGRDICTARKAHCDICPLKPECKMGRAAIKKTSSF